MGSYFSKKSTSSSSSDTSSSSDSSTNSGDDSKHHDSHFEPNKHTQRIIYAFTTILFAVIAVFISWNWNSRESSGMKVLYSIGAAIFAPMYILYSLLARNQYIKIENPNSVTKASPSLNKSEDNDLASEEASSGTAETVKVSDEGLNEETDAELMSESDSADEAASSSADDSESTNTNTDTTATTEESSNNDSDDESSINVKKQQTV